MPANWFGNSMWTSPGSGYSAASMHAMFSAGLYEREQEEKRRQEEEETQRLEELKKDQSRTRCYDSEQCASGFACVGGKCVYVDPTGATGDGGTAGCGAGVGGSGGSGGGGTGGSGCGGPAASSGGSSATVSIQACSTSSAGSCLGLRGSAGGGGGGGGSSCGKRCCSCGTNGCTCYEGECPPQPPTCSRFCTEADGLGANVMSCGPKECDICHYCDDLVSPPVCREDQPGADCRCGYQCPGCMQCSFAGNCLIKNCPSPPNPPEEAPGNQCEPECRDTEVCATNSSTGEVTCSTVQQCGDLPAECELCDCNCNNECPDCYICNSAGKCVTDPSCNNGDCGSLSGGISAEEGAFTRHLYAGPDNPPGEDVAPCEEGRSQSVSLSNVKLLSVSFSSGVVNLCHNNPTIDFGTICPDDSGVVTVVSIKYENCDTKATGEIKISYAQYFSYSSGEWAGSQTVTGWTDTGLTFCTDNGCSQVRAPMGPVCQ
jgi:hypothetical protein